ncbi:MAG: amino acid transporter permease [Pseudobdellovibrio sp.]|jgi:polar amino acid transport system substrate-binding protein|nr:amino acid transporter permease [Pseudobdellovibrio sp.]
MVSVGEAATLRWAADTESGAPYVFYKSENMQQMTGFEYDIAMALAKKLNREPVFVQNAWEGLVLGLESNLYDIAINGIEILEERQKIVNFSEPYYATYLQIVTRQGETRFKNLSDLAGTKVGTLSGALSEKVLRAQNDVQVLTYESETLAHRDLTISRSDALLVDAPIAKYFSEINPRFQVISTPISSMTYGIAVSKKNPELLKEINKALNEMKASGELKEILERWALWNSATATLFDDQSPTRLKPVHFEEYKESLNLERTFKERIDVYQKAMPLLLKGAWQTVRISFSAMIVAVLVGLILVSLRLYGNRATAFGVAFFVEFIRGTPLLLQLFFIFYGLPSVGLEISAFTAAVIGLGLNYSVQESEIYRSGLLSVHRNQVEAAKMLGLNPWQTFWSVQVPQAFRFCLPPMTTDFIALIKDSSLVSVITMVELTKTYSVLSATYYDYVGFAVIAASLYILIGMPLVVLSRKLERVQA